MIICKICKKEKEEADVNFDNTCWDCYRAEIVHAEKNDNEMDPETEEPEKLEQTRIMIGTEFIFYKTLAKQGENVSINVPVKVTRLPSFNRDATYRISMTIVD